MHKRIRHNVTISESTVLELRALAAEVSRTFDIALKALETADPDDALDVLESKQKIATLAEEATAHIAKRLVADEPNRLDAFQIETEIIETYKRFNSLTRRIARLAVQVHEPESDEAKKTE